MISLDGRQLTLARFRRVVLDGEPCALAESARPAIEASRRVVDEAGRGDAGVYGVNTGFGELSNLRIPADKTRLLQHRLLLSHAAGVGDPLSDQVVRGMLLLRANTLARGNSGVRPELIELLLALLDRGIMPVVPSRGSVGASGDLAPLAHLALPLIGESTVRVAGREMAAAAALEAAGLEPLQLASKEGLALINGTQAMTSLLALAALAARELVRLADLVGAMSTDAMKGSDTPFDPRLHELRPYRGQRDSAANLWRLMQDSEIRESHRDDDRRVQDAYCIRCMPQVHGAVRDVLDDVISKIEIEMNSVTDNPLVLPEDGDILPGGNFHGEPMALAADYLAIALAELGSISERRLEKLTDHHFSELPPFLVEDAGLNSGFMIAQVTAAALVSENKVLAHPASVDSIPTSAEKEDHVSMGMGAALKLRDVVHNVRRVLGIELLAAAQGLDLRRPLKSSEPLEALHAAVRRHVSPWDEDRQMSVDLMAVEDFVSDEVGEYLENLL